jgi:ubiquinone/menaquinone biosynthesis C-methylase UbiE
MAATDRESPYVRYSRAAAPYVEVLIELAEPRPSDCVLDVGTGSGTAARALGPLVRHVVAEDPSSALLAEATAKWEKERIELPVDRIVLQEGMAETIDQRHPEAAFDLVVVFFSLHHFSDHMAALRGVHRVMRGDGRLVIFDAFFPEPVRDFWTEASKANDPSTVGHHTYFEYMEMLRVSGFRPVEIRPFRHREELDRWFKRAGGDPDAQRQYREKVISSDSDTKRYMTIRKDEAGKWEFWYDMFALLARKD